jgi:hypothetical protein
MPAEYLRLGGLKASRHDLDGDLHETDISSYAFYGFAHIRAQFLLGIRFLFLFFTQRLVDSPFPKFSLSSRSLSLDLAP